MSTHDELVITAIGRDRPGLVSELTGLLLAAGANVADSRMVNLRGRFAVLLLAEGTATALAAARQAIETGAERMGLTVTFGKEAPVAAQGGVPWHLRTYSADQPGLVHRVSDLLRRQGVNIEALETRLAAAPFSGTRIFTMDLDLNVPPGVAIRTLREQLATLAGELNLDFDLDPGA